MPLKEDFYYLHFLRGGAHHATQEKHQVVRRQKTGTRRRACSGVSMRKAREGRVNSLGLASLNNSGRLWTIGMVSSYLIAGPGMI